MVKIGTKFKLERDFSLNKLGFTLAFLEECGVLPEFYSSLAYYYEVYSYYLESYCYYYSFGYFVCTYFLLLNCNLSLLLLLL